MDTAPVQPNGPALTVLDLFAGTGGLADGFRRAGILVVVANEIDAIAAATYARNHPTTRLIIGDIAIGETKDAIIQALAGRWCSIVSGGVPCQPWARCGNREGFGDSKGRLWFDFLDVVARLQPKPRYVIAENVGGLQDHPDALREIKSALESCGYRVADKILQAADFGAPQLRERLFIVATHDDWRDRPFAWPQPQFGSTDQGSDGL
jgi:DNA (cytosine-5)-methyltransferase 1